MLFRTDLASELKENLNRFEGIEEETKTKNGTKITKITVKTKEASKRIGKEIGSYVSLNLPSLTKADFDTKLYSKIISQEIKEFLPKEGFIFVIGLGNLNVTPDSLGPKSCKKVIATRHIKAENLRPVAILSPGVLGQTGLEIIEILKSIVKHLKPDCIILIDALASRSVERLGRAVQISNTGISPGSGVGNSRPLINKSELGVDVISIGMPMVVDAITLATDILETSNTKKIKEENKNMMVTPKDIDILIERSSKLIGNSINLAIHSELKFEDLH